MSNEPTAPDGVAAVTEPEVDLDLFIASLLSSGKGVKEKGGGKKAVKNPTPVRPLMEVPEVADALVLIATKVRCRTCGAEHISSSQVMRRIPRRDGTVYKPVVAPGVENLPRLIQWAWEEIQTCHWCFDMVPTVVIPDLTYYTEKDLLPNLRRLNGVQRCEYAANPPPWTEPHKTTQGEEMRLFLAMWKENGMMVAPEKMELVEPDDLAFRLKQTVVPLNEPRGEEETQ